MFLCVYILFFINTADDQHQIDQLIDMGQMGMIKTMSEKIETILAYVKRIDEKLEAMRNNINTALSNRNIENHFLN